MAEYTFQTTEIDEEILAELSVDFQASIQELMANLRREALRRRMTKRFDALQQLPQTMRKEVEAGIDAAIKTVHPVFSVDSGKQGI